MKSKSSSIETLKIDYPIEWEKELEKYPKKVKPVWSEEKLSFLKKYMDEYSMYNISRVLKLDRGTISKKIRELKSS